MGLLTKFIRFVCLPPDTADRQPTRGKLKVTNYPRFIPPLRLLRCVLTPATIHREFSPPSCERSCLGWPLAISNYRLFAVFCTVRKKGVRLFSITFRSSITFLRVGSTARTVGALLPSSRAPCSNPVQKNSRFYYCGAAFQNCLIIFFLLCTTCCSHLHHKETPVAAGAIYWISPRDHTERKPSGQDFFAVLCRFLKVGKCHVTTTDPLRLATDSGDNGKRDGVGRSSFEKGSTFSAAPVVLQHEDSQRWL